MGQAYPRYTTFKAGELETAVHELGQRSGSPITREAAGHLASGHTSGRKGLRKNHDCSVSFPDGIQGACHYLRCGPAWHQFRYEHVSPDGAFRSLPTQWETRRLENSIAVIEETAIRLATLAFEDAILRERKDYFQRAIAPSKMGCSRPQMKAKRAKELAGRYALCQPVGTLLIPVAATFLTLEEAITAWQGQSNHALVIACCCRWSRRWERPRFNPLHAYPDYPAFALYREQGPGVSREVSSAETSQEDAGWRD